MVRQWETARIAHFLRPKKGHSKRTGHVAQDDLADAALVATEGDEVEISASVIAPQSVTHRRKNPHPSKPQGAPPAHKL